MTEEGPPAPEDDDLNISYNCETCNKPVKGKVMLQVHIITNILCPHWRIVDRRSIQEISVLCTSNEKSIFFPGTLLDNSLTFKMTYWICMQHQPKKLYTRLKNL